MWVDCWWHLERAVVKTLKYSQSSTFISKINYLILVEENGGIVSCVIWEVCYRLYRKEITTPNQSITGQSFSLY